MDLFRSEAEANLIECQSVFVREKIPKVIKPRTCAIIEHHDIVIRMTLYFGSLCDLSEYNIKSIVKSNLVSLISWVLLYFTGLYFYIYIQFTVIVILIHEL